MRNRRVELIEAMRGDLRRAKAKTRQIGQEWSEAMGAELRIIEAIRDECGEWVCSGCGRTWDEAGHSGCSGFAA